LRPAVLPLLICAVLTTALSAQDTAAVAVDSAVAPVPEFTPDTAITPAWAPDTGRSPASPMGALWRSILIPGWGQAKFDRKLTGALFVAWEGVTLGMSIKTSHELQYLRRTNSGSASAKQKERQDWLVLLAFNHLFSAIEAYVSAHLWDFPEDLQIRAVPLPTGGVGAGVRLPVSLP